MSGLDPKTEIEIEVVPDWQAEPRWQSLYQWEGYMPNYARKPWLEVLNRAGVAE